jgi:glycosyltransferase involved in cell wall biosynthesis
MKVLVGAYACEPDTGSEPGVGWNWAVQAAVHGHDVHVITRSNNREAIERRMLDEPVAGLTFHYHDLPAPLVRWKRRGGYYGLLVYYYLWQLGAWRLARRLHATHRFDLAHHVTFVNDWMPSGVGWIGAPFVWGPVGGSTNVVPPDLRELVPRHARRYERVRRSMQLVLRSADPLVELTRRRAGVILTFTREALDGIPPRHRSKARPVVHIGVSEHDAPEPGPPEPDAVPGPEVDGLTIASGGRLVHWKGFDLLVEAFAAHRRAGGERSRLVITGDGPFRRHLERRIRALGLDGSVELLGMLPARADVYAVVAACDLYALPTLRDGPPVAILEAMLAGRPILCLDRGATAEMVPAEAGFKVAVHEREQVVRDLAAAMGWANDHRSELRRMGRFAREHALERHDWRRIGDTIDGVYRELLGARSSRRG